MLSIKESGILIYIIQHCKRIEEKISNVTREQFEKDIDSKEIVCFNIFQIGELAKSLSIDFISNYGNVRWKDIKGMRDIIGHGYGTIDLNIVWKTATVDIVPLRQYCEEILNSEKQITQTRKKTLVVHHKGLLFG